MHTQVYWFEASDMWGKTTQINRIAEKLKERNHSVLVLRNPGGEGVCKDIRSILLDVDKNKEEMSYMTRRALNQADYFEKLKIIYDNIGKYDYILCDRCTLISDMIYGFLLEENQDIRKIKREMFLSFVEASTATMCMLEKQTDKHIILNALCLGNISEEDLIERFNNLKRDDKVTIYDEKSLDFKMKIRNNYQKVFDIMTRRASNDADEDSKAIRKSLKAFDLQVPIYDFEKDMNEITEIIFSVINHYRDILWKGEDTKYV